jgi:hypothetical protein
MFFFSIPFVRLFKSGNAVQQRSCQMPIIHEYNQGKDPRWWSGEVRPEALKTGAFDKSGFYKTDTSSGVCFALSVWWIIKNAQGQDYWAWMQGPGPQVAAIKDLFRQQKTGDPSWDFHRFDVAKKKIEAETTLRQKSDVLMEEGTDFKHAGYYYISIQGIFGGASETSGHGITADIAKKGPCRYFDPNFGEGKADDSSKMLKELSDIVRKYKVSGVKIYHCCFA